MKCSFWAKNRDFYENEKKRKYQKSSYFGPKIHIFGQKSNFSQNRKKAETPETLLETMKSLFWAKNSNFLREGQISGDPAVELKHFDRPNPFFILYCQRSTQRSKKKTNEEQFQTLPGAS